MLIHCVSFLLLPIRMSHTQWLQTACVNEYPVLQVRILCMIGFSAQGLTRLKSTYWLGCVLTEVWVLFQGCLLLTEFILLRLQYQGPHLCASCCCGALYTRDLPQFLAMGSSQAIHNLSICYLPGQPEQHLSDFTCCHHTEKIFLLLKGSCD